MKNLRKNKEFQKIKKELISKIQKKERKEIKHLNFSFNNEYCKLYLGFVFTNGQNVDLFIVAEDYKDTEIYKRWSYKQLEDYLGVKLKNKIVSIIENY